MLKILSISICELTMPNTWQAKNDTWNKCIECVAHHLMGLAIFVDYIHNHWKIYNSFFNDDMMALLSALLLFSQDSKLSKLAIVVGT